jgi:hypothetical protein
MRSYLKSMSSLGAMVALTLLPCLSMAADGNDKGNGGFAYKRVRPLLEKAATDLVRDLRDAPNELFAPIGGKKELLRKSLAYENLVQLPNERRYRDEQLLDLDYDLATTSVVVLEPFYQAFSAIPPEFEAGALRLMKGKLVHEAAHLFGLNEVESETFSKRVMRFADPDERRVFFITGCGYDRFVLNSVKVDGREALKEAPLGKLAKRGGGVTVDLGELLRGKAIRVEWRVGIFFHNGGAAEYCDTFLAIPGKIAGGKTFKSKGIIYTRFDLSPSLYTGSGIQHRGNDFIVIE